MKHRVSISILLALLLGLAGCQEKDVVTVSGAVERPGDYTYRPEWHARVYVKAAGGYLPEADPEGAHLVRTHRDTTDESRIDHARTSRWHFDRAPEVLPGDRISVPFRSYAVRLDTVRAVRDLALEWDGKVYRVSRGTVIPGWTDRGVMVAVVIGDGEVVGRDGGKRLGRFHYLHLRMHPDEYARLLPDVGAPLSDREALEDAEEIYSKLLDKSAYRSGVELTVPPAGYLRVLAGMWLAPKSRSFPGRGMRKRRYPDGRTWTTFPDGRQRMEHPDGKVVVEFPDSTRETRYADGRTAFLDAAGNLLTRYADGKRIWELANGNRTEIFPDGRRVHRYATGMVRTVLPDGIERVAFPDGARAVRYQDGRMDMISPSGQRETHHTDGRVVAVTPEGHEITAYPDGRKFVQMVDGTEIEVFPDGRRVQRNPTGETLEILPDGSRRTVHRDSSEMVRQADGRLTVRYASGNLLEIFPDGREVRTDAQGNRTEILPDGAMRKTSVRPYRYGGTLRKDLAEIERLPEWLLPGSEIPFSGTVSDSIRRLSVMMFELPDGDVVELPVEMRRGRFRGRLRVEAPGYYRLQVHVELKDGRMEAAEDRVLKAGNPPPLPVLTVEIAPFPGPEMGEWRIAGLIGRERERLERRNLLLDSALMDAARAHLREMIAMGYFAHRSPVTGTVRDRLEKRRVRFGGVAENLSRAPSLEEAHISLMGSAGHRRNILDARWTHLGVAVAREGEEVWVVEVFAWK